MDVTYEWSEVRTWILLGEYDDTQVLTVGS